MAEPLLEARGIVKSFGRVRALRGASFTVNAGEVVALIGDNGAGKSTLVKMLSGVLHPDDGEIRFEGQPVDDLRTPSPRASWGSRPSTRTSRSRRTWSRRPTCSSAARRRAAALLGKLGFLDKARDAPQDRGGVHAARRRRPGPDRRRGDAVRRPAPGRRGRPRGHLGGQGRVHGRADGRARRRADPQRARPHPPRARAPACRSCSSATTCRRSWRSPTGSRCCGSASAWRASPPPTRRWRSWWER